MKIIITIPAYNEEKILGSVISDIKKVLGGTKYKDYKILVVNDGSTDKTKDIAKKAGAMVYSHPINYGLAETFRTEIKLCLKLGANVIIHIDADGQYPPYYIPQMINKIEEGYDLVLGSRFMGKIEYMPFIKRIGNKAFSKVISKITRMKITDAQTGFRAFTKEVAQKIDLISTHTYTQEQVIKAVREKFKIKEIPVDTRKTRKSKLMRNPFEYAIKAWTNLLRIYRDYKPLKFFGTIGSILLLVGLLLGIYILYSIITTGYAGGTPRVVLTALLILTGIQIWLFGFLADMQKK